MDYYDEMLDNWDDKSRELYEQYSMGLYKGSEILEKMYSWAYENAYKALNECFSYQRQADVMTTLGSCNDKKVQLRATLKDGYMEKHTEDEISSEFFNSFEEWEINIHNLFAEIDCLERRCFEFFQEMMNFC